MENDGGPAFPGKGIVGHRKHSGLQYSEHHPGEPIKGDIPGMSLRDYFAAKALSGLLSDLTKKGADEPKDFARVSYAIADAMLSERKK